jgi:hypothetical protein
LGLAGAVGEEAEVPNADEALGDDVEEEAADELHTGREIDEALVGEGDAVSVAPEGLEHLRGAGEGGLGVDDPVVLAEAGEPRGEGAGLREGVGEA